MKYKSGFVIEYFTSRGWHISHEGRIFLYLTPPKNLKLSDDFLLEIPKNESLPGYDNYISNLIDSLIQILPVEEFHRDDLQVLFAKEQSILKYRVYDHENEDGTINLQKYIDLLETFKKVLSHTVTFAVTQKPLFGDSKFEVQSYLNYCRAMQSEKGSYVTKIEIPNTTINSTISVVETSYINNKFFDIIEYVNDEVINPSERIIINENYLTDKKDKINFELLSAIRDIYSKTNINNLEYKLTSIANFRIVQTNQVQGKLKYFNSYLKDLKNALLKVVPLETVGKIKKLFSYAPMHSNRNEVIIDAEVANTKETIKIILKSKEYLLAIEAHKNEWPIKIKGKAVQSKTILTINELEIFEPIISKF